MRTSTDAIATKLSPPPEIVIFVFKVIPLFCTAHPLLCIILWHPSWRRFSVPASTKRTNKGRFCRAKAFFRNNNAVDSLTASWFAIEKQENERNVRDPEVFSGSYFKHDGRYFVSRPNPRRANYLSWLRSQNHVHLSQQFVRKQARSHLIFFQVFAKTNSLIKNIFEEKKSLIVEHFLGGK